MVRSVYDAIWPDMDLVRSATPGEIRASWAWVSMS